MSKPASRLKVFVPIAPIAVLTMISAPCSAQQANKSAAVRSAYQTNSTTNGGSSLFLGDQAPGTENGGNTVAGIGTGGKLSPGSTGYGGQFDTLIGAMAAPNATTARESTCIGAAACFSLQGSDSGVEDSIVTVIGSQAMGSMVNDVLSSTFIGQKSALDLKHSYYDIFVGNHSGIRVNRSQNTTFIGGFVAAGDNLGTNGSSDVTYNSYNNTIVGSEAAETPSSNADKSENTVVGSRAFGNWGAATGNAVFGFGAGRRMTDASYNTCFGWECFWGSTSGIDVTTTGTYNVGVGAYALPSVSTGFGNIGMGFRVGEDLTTGSENIMFGSYSGNRVGSGSHNVLIGRAGLGSKYNYSNVLAMGFQSCINPDDGMVCIGYRAGANHQGSGNLMIGRNSAQYLGTGQDNLVIGQDAAQMLSGSESGNTLIGNKAEVAQGCSNTVQIGSGYNANCGTVQLGNAQFVDSKGRTVSKGAVLSPLEIFHITTDGSTTVTRSLANYVDDATVSFGARNSLAAQNMSGVFATNAIHGTLTITVPAVAGMQIDVTVAELQN